MVGFVVKLEKKNSVNFTLLERRPIFRPLYKDC
jgi:hypothetical protein